MLSLERPEEDTVSHAERWTVDGGQCIPPQQEAHRLEKKWETPMMDAVWTQGSEASEACPWGIEGTTVGSDEDGRPDKQETDSLGGALRRAMDWTGLSRGGGCGVERPG